MLKSWIFVHNHAITLAVDRVTSHNKSYRATWNSSFYWAANSSKFITNDRVTNANFMTWFHENGRRSSRLWAISNLLLTQSLFFWQTKVALRPEIHRLSWTSFVILPRYISVHSDAHNVHFVVLLKIWPKWPISPQNLWPSLGSFSQPSCTNRIPR